MFAQPASDPGAFVDEADFEALIEANNPVAAARELVLHQGDVLSAMQCIEQAMSNPLLRDSNSLSKLRERLENAQPACLLSKEQTLRQSLIA